jgi:hypothetical protein
MCGGDCWFAAFLGPAGNGGQQLEMHWLEGGGGGGEKPRHYSAQSESARRFWDGFGPSPFASAAICKPRLQMDPRVSRRTADPQRCDWVHDEEWLAEGGRPAHPLQLLESGHDATKQLHSAHGIKYITVSINQSLSCFTNLAAFSLKRGHFRFLDEPPKIAQSQSSSAGSNEALGAGSFYAYSTHFHGQCSSIKRCHDVVIATSLPISCPSMPLPSRSKLATHRLPIPPVHDTINPPLSHNGIKEKEHHHRDR